MKAKALIGTALIFLCGCHSNSLGHNLRSARTHVQIIMLCEQLSQIEARTYASLAALTPCMRQFQDYALTEVHTDWAQAAGYRYQIALSPARRTFSFIARPLEYPTSGLFTFFADQSGRSPRIDGRRPQ